VDGLHVPAGGALPQSPTALPIERSPTSRPRRQRDGRRLDGPPLLRR
jgi:hypothetical protein